MGNTSRKHNGARVKVTGESAPRAKESQLGAPSFATQCRGQLEEALAQVVQSKCKSNRKSVKFNRLLLKFPSLYSGFSKCKMVFQNVDIDNDGGVTLEELKAGCAKLGYQLTDEELESTFAATDLNKNKVLDVKEFVVVLAILHMLGGSQEGEQMQSIDPDILRTFETCEDAFLCFNSSRRGYIDKEELMSMMHEAGTETIHHHQINEGNNMQSVIAQRFAELDRDKDGKISFLEFLFCLEGWVIDAEDNDNTLET